MAPVDLKSKADRILSARNMSEWVDISVPGAEECFWIFNDSFQ